MQLTLTYSPDAHGAPAAVFLRGAETRWWLEHFRAWNVLPEDMVLLPLAEAGSQSAAGLFVIFKEGHTPDISLLPEPFIAPGTKMYIPFGSTLKPALSLQELDTLCHWKYQLLHPSLGFYGLDAEDELDPANLVRMPEPVEETWPHTPGGFSPLPRLTRIRVEAPVMAAIAIELEKLGIKDTDNIPPVPGAPDSSLGRIGVEAQFWMLAMANALLGKFVTNGKETKGKLGKLTDKVRRRLNALQEMRGNDSERLLRMFKDNPELALKYALPLDPNARPGSNSGGYGSMFPDNSFLGLLFGKLLNSPGRSLPGNGRTIMLPENTYRRLEDQYRITAAEAEAAGDWSRAAYVHAHLLKNYHAAAEALRKGKLYHDAANMYLNKLDNIHKAAECFKEGGLYDEAIRLYLKMELFTEAGDLHRLNGDDAAAVSCYEKTIAYNLRNNNFLAAAEITRTKLEDSHRARNYLLNGWYADIQAESCLEAYFRSVEGALPAAMRHAHDVLLLLPGKERKFLTVISKFKNDTPETADAIRDLAFLIIGKAAGEGDADLLSLLPGLVPDDPFLRNDTSLFLSTLSPAARKPVKKKIDALELRRDVFWFDVKAWRQQILVFGDVEGKTLLARCNWEGEVEYHECPFRLYFDQQDGRNVGDYLISLTELDNRLIIMDVTDEVNEFTLPALSAFGDSLTVLQNPPPLTHEPFRLGRRDNELIYTEAKNGKYYLLHLKPEWKEPQPLFRIGPGLMELGLYPIFVWDYKYFIPDGGNTRMIVCSLKSDLQPAIYEGDFSQICGNGKWIAWIDDGALIKIMDADTEGIQTIRYTDAVDLRDITFLSPFILAAVAGERILLFLLKNDGWYAIEGDLPLARDCIKIIPGVQGGRFGLLTLQGTLTFHNFPEVDA